MQPSTRTLLALIPLAFASCAADGAARGDDAASRYNTPIPASITTPDRVDTSIGTLRFFDGFPTAETVEASYDYLDRMRGVECFLNGIPAASLESARQGAAGMGADACHRVVIFDRLLDSNPLFLTGNTDTVYVLGFMDLEQDGPVVVEIPPGCGPGTVDDAYFRFVVDMGAPGPDRGQGGKYLILPPDYDGDLDPPAGGMQAEVDGTQYFVAKSTSYVNALILRGFLVDGKPDAATRNFREGLKVYPLSSADAPPAMEFISGSGKEFNTIHANDFHFYEELHGVIDREPISMLDPELRGLFAAIGLQKGKPFAPDDRMRGLLAESAAIGNSIARCLVFRPRLDGWAYYEDSAWGTAFVGGSHEWLRDGGAGGRYLDARTLFFYQATVNTPAMVMKLVGKGSQYAYAVTDSQDRYLDGGETYRLRLPANAPAKDFWSVVVYDPQTRSELQTGQPFPSKNDKRDALATEDDGSVVLYFGPEAPEGKESNWIQTVPGKGFYAILRLYGPLEPWFDKTWRPGEFERL